ncbi:hypothetical protein P3W45_001462 [Vairimorpha bombi]|jgi:V-type H+-transporting ATPase subunit C
MYLFIGLPLENNIDLQDELSKIESDNNVSILSLNIPKFSNLCISSCSSYDDMLIKMEKECTDLVKQFTNNKKYFLEFSHKFMDWDTEKYGSTNIDECIKMVKEDLKHIKNIYTERRNEQHNNKKQYDDIIRKTQGTLAERDISYMVDTKHYEFLEDVYVVVNKENWSKFVDFINKSDISSIETLERLHEDDIYVLCKILILKTDVKLFKKECITHNFIIKDVHKVEEESVKKKMEEIDSKKDSLDVFLDTHYVELYRILVHIKLMKLFVDSFCRYGLPKDYAFFVCTGDKLFYKFKKICENWKSDRVVEDSDEGDDQYQTNYAHTIVEVNDGDK